MLIYSPGSDVTLTFDMLHPETSDVLEPSAASYRVYDDEGSEVVAATAVAVSGGEQSLSVTVAAVHNSISGATNGARTVVLSVTSPQGSVELVQSYVLEIVSFLAVPAESGMTVSQSLVISRGIAQGVIEIWSEVEDRERKPALIEAWNRLAKLPYKPWLDFDEIPSGVDENVINGEFRINELSSEQWALLPTSFKNALKRAQIIEAAVILEGDPTWDRRQDGLISKTVGESSEMFTSKKSAVSSISPKAYREIRGYIMRRISVGRG